MVSPPLLSIPSCPAPFINQALYPASKGFTAGRICSPIGANTTCCLPCPALDWFYPENFYHRTSYAGYIATASLSLCIFMLVTWMVLPPEKTKRHHLNMSLVASLLLMELGVAIPVLRKPDRCADPITPADQGSSMTCAWGGALIVYGFAATNAWIFTRAIQTHLLIVWDIPTPKHSFLASQLFSWTLAGILLTTTLTVTGVSCRLGDYCFFNLKDSWASFWGPSLVFASITTFLTFGTAGYCLYVYVKSVFVTARPNSDLQTPSIARPTAIAVWRRVRAVILLQWRPITIVTVLLLDLVTAIAVFVYTNTVTGNAINHPESYTSWLLCLIVHPKNKDTCLPLVRDRNPYPATLQTPFVLLSLTGIVAFLVLSTKGMITGWFELVKNLPHSIPAAVKELDNKGYTLYKRIYNHFHTGVKKTASATKSNWAFLTSIGPPAGLKVTFPTLRLPTIPPLSTWKLRRPSLNRHRNSNRSKPKRPRPTSVIKKTDISRPTNARMSIGPMIPSLAIEQAGPIRIATSGTRLKMASRPSNDFVSPPRSTIYQETQMKEMETKIREVGNQATPTRPARPDLSPSSGGKFSEAGLVGGDATPVRYSREIFTHGHGGGAIGMTSGSDFQTPEPGSTNRKRGSKRGSNLVVAAAAAGGVVGAGAGAAVARVSPLNFHPVVESASEAETGDEGDETEKELEPPEGEMGEGVFEMEEGVEWSDVDESEKVGDQRQQEQDMVRGHGNHGIRDKEDDDIWNDEDEDDEDDSLFYETSPSKMA